MSSTVSRAIEILELCSAEPRTAAQIAAVLGVHRTTVLRTLLTLQDAGLVRQTETGVFGTGFRLAALAKSAMAHFDLRGIAHPHLKDLSDRIGVTVQFAVPDRDRIRYVDKIEPRDSIVLNTEIGGDAVVSTSGVAKAILAHLSGERRRSILDRATFETFTERSITSREAFERELTRVQERGWSFDDGEYDELSNCIAAPVRDHADDVAGAVSITAFRTRLDIDALQQHLPALLTTTEAISRDLGWRGSAGSGSA
ncbi:IclR family transcriptional regulator [Zhihengliuella halotolerans]|uniref:IclR family transcriptional regulator n=1 Tax=Zhihengliuella halotolerans TaxID=370736 RepID=A0A4Q8AEY9_9MICC|nr:IclR family transcriptional regulator [Zhihengliuella halotolerans]RZU62764.1 IclR family transcriptional regulator [Zhihengliuella halotolerans]